MSELSAAREAKQKRDETFRYARQRCLEVTAQSVVQSCSQHFTGSYDRRKSRVSDRRQFKVDKDTVTPRRRVTFRDVGRRVGDLPWPRLPIATKPTAEPVKVATKPTAEPVKVADRRASGTPRRQGPVDRRVVRTEGHPLRRKTSRGRRAGDVSYNRLPRASLPVVKGAHKQTLKERVLLLHGSRPSQSLVDRESVLDLLKEYGVEDA